MRKTARMLGLIWIAAAMIVVACLWVAYTSANVPAGFYRSPYSLALIFFALVVPGALLYRWGKGSVVRGPASAELMRPKAPYSRASEMGHVLELDKHPDA